MNKDKIIAKQDEYITYLLNNYRTSFKVEQFESELSALKTEAEKEVSDINKT